MILDYSKYSNQACAITYESIVTQFFIVQLLPAHINEQMFVSELMEIICKELRAEYLERPNTSITDLQAVEEVALQTALMTIELSLKENLETSKKLRTQLKKIYK